MRWSSEVGPWNIGFVQPIRVCMEATFDAVFIDILGIAQDAQSSRFYNVNNSETTSLHVNGEQDDDQAICN